MTTFLKDNALFLVSVVLLAGLIGGASQLQKMQDAQQAALSNSQPQTTSNIANVPSQSETPATSGANANMQFSAQSNVQISTPTTTVAPPVIQPQIQPRIITNEETDD